MPKSSAKIWLRLGRAGRERAWMIGGGIGSLAAAAFMIRDDGVPGDNITLLEAAEVLGGSLDAGGDAATR